MSGNTCPNGHVSESADYCDTCGAPIVASSTPPSGSPSGPVSAPVTPGTGASPATTAATKPCPSCAITNTAEALFCEACGYDFTTGSMPRSATPAPGHMTSTNPLDLGATPEGATVPDPLAPAVELEWVAEVWVDPDWYAGQESDEELPSPGLPVVVPLRTRSLLIGRRSVSRNIHPDIDCASDVGVSRRQAQLTTDGQRWWVEDLQSSNGTYVGAASGPLPEDALPPGQRRELAEDDRIYLGAWTRIVVRRATPEEQAGEA
ncbi:MAG TPA: FHA domain-containing protein [Dermatophilaceae bacterium]